MDLGIKGKTALVTAASRGIGRACAQILAEEGCNVVICARGLEALQKTSGEISSTTGAKVLPYKADLSSPADLEALVNKTVETYGSLDIAVAIGAPPRRGAFDKLDDGDLLAAFEATVLSLARLCRLVIPHMQAKKWGRVVTIQSRSVREPIQDLTASNSTRPGAAGLIKSLATEYSGYGISFNTVIPGRINTERFRSGADVSKLDAADYFKSKLSDIPLSRFGTPEDMANMVVFLASERASYITGAVIPVDGGVIRAI